MKVETPERGTSQVRRTLSIGAPPDVLLEAWRQPAVQQQVLGDAAELLSGDAEAMRWRVALPVGGPIELESRQVGLVPGQSVQYGTTSTGSADLQARTTFSVRPAPADFGTEVTIEVDYHLPGGLLGEAAAKVFGAAPDVLAGKALRRFKALIEAGEIPTLARNASARDDDR